MTRYRMQLLEFVGVDVHGGSTLQPGAFVKSYDPEAHDGRGFVEWTTDPDEAVIFHSPAQALRLYQQVPVTRPYRADGKPNRPLTAFTIEVTKVEP